MGKAGVSEQPARIVLMLVMNENATRQNAERPLEHAHVLIEHDMGDLGGVEQCLDGRDQHGVIGADKLAQRMFSR
jgi:hypothetical protein